jgi:membrane-bound ClpP family serine protease
MNKLIENNIDNDRFYLSSALSELSGRLKGNAESLADKNLSSLDKEYYSEKIMQISNDVKDLWEYLHSINHSSVEVK